MSDFQQFPPKHQTAKLDYLFDWAPKRNNRGLSNWLRDGETITTYVFTLPDDLTKISESLINEDSAAQILLSGGTLNTEYNFSCSIITSEGREDTRTASIFIKQR